MARYIDVEALYKILNERDVLEMYEDYMAVNRAINDTPTADVVPKSEVEKLREINSLLTEAGLEWQKRYENLAREIFEEIEKIFDGKKYVPYPIDAIAELKKRYTKDVEVVRDLAEYTVDQDIQNYKENK